jgi:LEA14-like dessication related protein
MRVLSMLLLVFVWACAAFPAALERPRAEVRDVRIEALSLAGLRGEVDLDVFNPNAFAVPLDRVEWQLEIGGADTAGGSVRLAEAIPARGSAPLVIGLQLDGSDAAALARQLAAGERSYTLRGVMHFTTSLGEIPVSFVESGDITDVLQRLSTAACYGAHRAGYQARRLRKTTSATTCMLRPETRSSVS